MKKKTKLWIGIGICICILGVIGVSFALWNKVFVQSGENLVNSDCFELTFEEKDGIQLENSFPMYDSDGVKLKPYTFKISNKCNNEVDYQLNLETTKNTTLKDNYIKVMLNDSEPYLYSSKEEVEVTITNGKGARVLESGILNGNEVKEYELRVWMDEKVTQNDEGAMNGVFESKITITATYRKPTLASIIKSQPIVTNGNGLYEVSHEDAEITYTDDVNAQNLLKETELRYAGSNPNNYVLFNNELWRIIGLVNTPEGQRVKIIRDESIGEYSWDSSETGVNSGRGTNEWSTSFVMRLLNGGYESESVGGSAYWNKSSSTCYVAINGVKNTCDFSNSGLIAESKEMIDEVTWNIGAVSDNPYDEQIIMNMYNKERGNNTGKGCSEGKFCNDEITRMITWRGKIGLMYPSDYGYATSGGEIKNRDSCLFQTMYDWSKEEFSDCSNYNWLHQRKDSIWTIMPTIHTVTGDYVFVKRIEGGIHAKDSCDGTSQIYPTLYLKENVKTINGTGTQDNPYLLSMDA